jgi:hypothetical protein
LFSKNKYIKLKDISVKRVVMREKNRKLIPLLTA